MAIAVPGFRQHISLAPDKLLIGDEIIVLVDDDPALRDPLRIFLGDHGLAAESAANAEEMFKILAARNVALIILDIGLPDEDGVTLIPHILEQYPDVALVMLTGVADLQTALECIRKGADDYLSKPVQFNEIFFAVKKALEKRRLVFENRRYQEELEKSHFRTQLLHQLSMQMNTVYLSTVELDEILQGILVGITANEGLRFNRAFLAMFNDEHTSLEGSLAIGPNSREDAGKIWDDMQRKELNFIDIVQNIRETSADEDVAVNAIIKYLKVPTTYEEHILIKAAMERRSVRVENGHNHDCVVPGDLLELLGEDAFVVVPLYSPGRSFGVIIADNFITRDSITKDHVQELEIFASQASLAIEQSHLYKEMQEKIGLLEDLTQELDENKDLLVQAERYSALGQMATQMVHAIRNPITSIGGVSRILSRKLQDTEWTRFCSVISKETERIEQTLDDLFNFVTQAKAKKEVISLQPLINKSLLLLQTKMSKQGITWEMDYPNYQVEFAMDGAMIRQMLVHLVKNAVEAMPEGGQLKIAVRPERNWVRISVHDTGAGIPEGSLEAAKDPFFTTKTYGTGLGLSMVERVAKAHGGNYVIESKEEGGTEVQVNLPLSHTSSFE